MDDDTESLAFRVSVVFDGPARRGIAAGDTFNAHVEEYPDKYFFPAKLMRLDKPLERQGDAADGLLYMIATGELIPRLIPGFRIDLTEVGQYVGRATILSCEGPTG